MPIAGKQVDGVFPTLESQGKTTLSGIISPAAISGLQSDWNPSGWSTATIIRMTSSTPGDQLDGLTGGAAGRVAILTNVNAGTSIEIVDTIGSGSLVANQFALPGSLNITLQAGGTVEFYYDGTSSLWRPKSVAN